MKHGPVDDSHTKADECTMHTSVIFVCTHQSSQRGKICQSDPCLDATQLQDKMHSHNTQTLGSMMTTTESYTHVPAMHLGWRGRQFSSRFEGTWLFVYHITDANPS